MLRLKDLREDNDLLLKSISHSLKIPISTISDYENERTLLPPELLCKFANYYNVSTDYIVYNTDERICHKLKRNNKESNRLKNLRMQKKLTQNDLAKELNIIQNAYSKYELGQRKIPIDSLIILSNFYNTSIDYILCRTNDISPYKKSIINSKEK